MRGLSIASISLCLLCFVFSSCKEEPLACIDVPDEDFLVPSKAIQFGNCSSNASEYHWDFGDGESSTEKEPSHQFPVGRHHLKLSVFRDNHFDELTYPITVDHPTFANLRIERIAPKAPSGMNWDPNTTGPDARVKIISSQSASPAYSSLIVQNIDQLLPYEFPLSQLDIKAECCDWQILVLDVNATVDTIAAFEMNTTGLEAARTHTYETADSTLVVLELEI